MADYNCSVKDGELRIKSKLGKDEQVNPRELELLSGGSIRGVMKVKRGSFGKLIFTAPAAEPLKRYLMRGLTKEEFASVVAQFVRVLMELDRYALQMRNLELYVEGVYITPATRELMFIYRPVVNKSVGCDLNGFIRSLIEFATFSTLQDRAYVSELESVLRDIEKFPPKTMSDYVRRLDKETYDRELARMDRAQQAQYAPPQGGWGAPAPDPYGGYAGQFGQTPDFSAGLNGGFQAPEAEDETTYGGTGAYGEATPMPGQGGTTDWNEEPTGIDNSYEGTSNGYWVNQRPAQSGAPNYEEMVTGLWEDASQTPAPASTPGGASQAGAYSPPPGGFEPNTTKTPEEDAAPSQPYGGYDEATNIDFGYSGYGAAPQQNAFSGQQGAYSQPRSEESFDEPLTMVSDEELQPEPSYAEPAPYTPPQPAFNEPLTDVENDYAFRNNDRRQYSEPAPERRRQAPAVRATLERCGTGDVYTIKQDEVLIGKDRLGADIYIDGNPAVSRRHALITSRGGRFYITDMRSLNHTFVNGREIRAEQELEIKDGSRLCLADENFIFRIR